MATQIVASSEGSALSASNILVLPLHVTEEVYNVYTCNVLLYCYIGYIAGMVLL